MTPGPAALAAPPAGATSDAPVEALVRLLDELTAVLIELPVDVYVATPAARVSGSIGGHVRHTLDHIGALLAADPASVLSYDHRERGTAVERDPGAAVGAILRLKAALQRRASADLASPLVVESMVTADGQAVEGWSTLGREMAFVISHTIHHHAIIALLLSSQSFDVPHGFGRAPSTPART